MNDNMCLDVPGGDPTRSEDLQMWQCNGQHGQVWSYDVNTMSIYPYKTGEKMCLDTDQGSLSPGTGVNLYPCSPGKGMRWISPAPSPPPPPPFPGCQGAIRQFKANSDKSKCWHIDGGTQPKNGDKVMLRRCDGGDHKKFMWCSDGRIV